jgi:DNA-directed RNA polymerase III subunit RPC3
LPLIAALTEQLFLEQVVAAKLGEPGGRLYRILLRHHANGGCASRGQQKLELKQLAEQALLPERDARPLLLRLLQDEYVFLQEVPRTADRNPKTTFYLWYVSLPHALRTLEGEILRTLHHLYGRLAHETKLARGGQAAAAAVAAGSSSRAVPDLGGETSRQQLLDAKRRTDYLEAAILKLHKTLLVLRTQV